MRTVASAELSQILGEIPGVHAAESQSNDSADGNWLEQGMAFIDQGNFQAAWQALKRAERDNPSCPDTNAALGWAAYHVKHQVRMEDDPEDFLRLALTLEPEHVDALEYYARISLKRGELERAEPLLERLLKQRPTATWAQRELSQIRAVQSRDKGRRFGERETINELLVPSIRSGYLETRGPGQRHSRTHFFGNGGPSTGRWTGRGSTLCPTDSTGPCGRRR